MQVRSKIITAPKRDEKLALLRCLYYGNKDMYSKLKGDGEFKKLGLVDWLGRIKN